MELLDDDDFQQLAQNPMAAQIVEQVHSNPEAFRRCATALCCQGFAGRCCRVRLSLLLFAHMLSWHWRLLIGGGSEQVTYGQAAELSVLPCRYAEDKTVMHLLRSLQRFQVSPCIPHPTRSRAPPVPLRSPCLRPPGAVLPASSPWCSFCFERSGLASATVLRSGAGRGASQRRPPSPLPKPPQDERVRLLCRPLPVPCLYISNMSARHAAEQMAPSVFRKRADAAPPDCALSNLQCKPMPRSAWDLRRAECHVPLRSVNCGLTELCVWAEEERDEAERHEVDAGGATQSRSRGRPGRCLVSCLPSAASVLRAIRTLPMRL